MPKKRTPTPEELARLGGSRRTVTFRIDEVDHAALVTIAKRAGIGHATLCRRVVEAYIREHAPKRRG